MKITFWKDNRLDGEHQVDVQKIIKDFRDSNLHDNYLKGMLFDRCLVLFMSDAYGAFDLIQEHQWLELKNAYALSE